MSPDKELYIYVFTAPPELAGTVVPFEDARKLRETADVIMKSTEPGNVIKWGEGPKWMLIAKAREELSSTRDTPDADADAFRQRCARNVLNWIFEQDDQAEQEETT